MFQLLKNWKEVIDTCNLCKERKMDFLSKWMIATRACVFSMTMTSVLVGALLGLIDRKFNLIYAVLALVALALAHASNNLINDYFDYKQGLDTEDYPRTQYSPHPIASKLITEKQLLGAFFGFSAIELAVAIFFTVKCGIWAIIFAAAGFLLSIFYVAPPLKLKYRGLGELAIFLIWGPLITVGTYYVMAGSMPLKIWLASIPYGLVVTNVLLGKHLDKYEKDKEKGVKTLSVVLGFENAINFTIINTALFYVAIIVLVILRFLNPVTLIVLLSLWRFVKFVKILKEKKPDKQPENFSIWPLWYVAWAFWFNKMAGGFFILGLILSALPWLKF